MAVATQAESTFYVAMRFPEKLKKHRTERHMTQRALAEQVGVIQSHVAKWEAGDGRPYYDQALKIAKSLGLSLDYLADDEMESPSDARGGGEVSEGEQAILAIVRKRGLTWAFLALSDPPVIRDLGPRGGRE
jgi:transcriptional regulator with XRE-family HTH domain